MRSIRLQGGLLLAITALIGGCKCGTQPLGPLEEARPADLGPTGLLIEQPKDGETITGSWVAVSGWIDRSKIDAVLVMGAPSFDLYAPTGHVGLPTVPVMLREDGRFIAPRVPLQDGATQIQVMGFTKDVVTVVTLINVTGSGTEGPPVTLTLDPPYGNAPLVVKLAAHAATATSAWQWDFEGDGTFDVEETAPNHTYAAGRFAALARTRIDNRWVYGLSPLVVSVPGVASHNNTSVTAPKLVVVVPTYSFTEPVSETSNTRAILVADGDTVKVFSPTLNPLLALTGLAAPTGLAGDEQGRIYVSDTGHDQLKRFTALGALDPSFADGGVLSGISRPGSLSYELRQSPLEDGGVLIKGWSLSVLDGRGHLLTITSRDPMRVVDVAAPFNIRDSQPLIAKDFVQPQRWDGAPQLPGPWFSSAGALYRPGQGGPVQVESMPAMRAYTTASDLSLPYWAAIDGDGNLNEWLDVRWNRRFTDLDFDATSVAIDPSASEYLHQHAAAENERGPWTFGPTVLYVAGAGRLERRVAPVMRGGLR